MPAHSESRHLAYTPRQMYDLVADVGSYPEFLPWNAAARVRNVTDHPDGTRTMDTDLVVSFKVFRESFVSRVTLWEDERVIQTEYINGPFRHMKAVWRFESAEDGGCIVHFNVDFAFRNRLLQSAAELFFYEAMRRIVSAFEARAKALYG